MFILNCVNNFKFILAYQISSYHLFAMVITDILQLWIYLEAEDIVTWMEKENLTAISNCESHVFNNVSSHTPRRNIWSFYTTFIIDPDNRIGPVSDLCLKLLKECCGIALVTKTITTGKNEQIKCFRYFAISKLYELFVFFCKYYITFFS